MGRKGKKLSVIWHRVAWVGIVSTWFAAITIVHAQMPIVDDRPTWQFIHCEEIVDLNAPGYQSFEELKKQDPWKLWLKLEKWEGQYPEAVVDPGLFDFSLEGNDYDDYVIVAISTVGGRGYKFDPRWLCQRLVFRSERERELLATWTSKFFGGGLDSGARLRLFLAIPYPHGIASISNDSEGGMIARRFIAAFLGDFLHVEGMREFVYDVAFGDKDPTVREQCLKSILSVYEELPEDALASLKSKVASRETELKSSSSRGTGWAEKEVRLLAYLREKSQSDNPSSIVPK